MLTVGITGGVGAGKSTVLNHLEEEYGAYILQTDLAAHKLMEPGQDCYNRIVEAFGKDILTPEGPIDRVKLGAVVFADSAKLDILNGITHPAVQKYVNDTIARLRESGEYPIMAVEAALLIEGGYKNICDELWYIYASEEIRRERLIRTRNYSNERIDGIFQNQLPDAVFRENCVVTIDTGISVDYTMEQVDAYLTSKGILKHKK